MHALTELLPKALNTRTLCLESHTLASAYSPWCPSSRLTKDWRAFVGANIMKGEVKEGAEFVNYDAHEGFHV